MECPGTLFNREKTSTQTTAVLGVAFTTALGRAAFKASGWWQNRTRLEHVKGVQTCSNGVEIGKEGAESPAMRLLSQAACREKYSILLLAVILGGFTRSLSSILSCPQNQHPNLASESLSPISGYQQHRAELNQLKEFKAQASAARKSSRRVNSKSHNHTMLRQRVPHTPWHEWTASFAPPVASP